MTRDAAAEADPSGNVLPGAWQEVVESVTPFDPKQGILWKSGRVAGSPDEHRATLGALGRRLGVTLPADFAALVEPYTAGEFDGLYKVADLPEGAIVWISLLVLHEPGPIDRQLEEFLGRRLVAAEIVETEGSVLRRDGGAVRFVPFGRASLFRPDGTFLDGYLAFDVTRDNRVCFVSADGVRIIEIAPTFRAMMLGSLYVFMG